MDNPGYCRMCGRWEFDLASRKCQNCGWVDLE